MKRETFLKKAKKLGLTVDESNRRCYIVHNGIVASWFWQEHWETKELVGTNWYTAVHTKECGERIVYTRNNLNSLKNFIKAKGDTFTVTFW